MSETCANCKWFTSANEACHRYPPAGDVRVSGKESTRFPQVASTDWCGEFTASANEYPQALAQSQKNALTGTLSVSLS